MLAKVLEKQLMQLLMVLVLFWKKYGTTHSIREYRRLNALPTSKSCFKKRVWGLGSGFLVLCFGFSKSGLGIGISNRLVVQKLSDNIQKWFVIIVVGLGRQVVILAAQLSVKLNVLWHHNTTPDIDLVATEDK